jgi:hypothetical protein
MVIKLDDSYGVKEGDKFLLFRDHGVHYHEGLICEVDSSSIVVDFLDRLVEFPRLNVGLFEEHCGFIRKFYSSSCSGQVIKEFN